MADDPTKPSQDAPLPAAVFWDGGQTLGISALILLAFIGAHVAGAVVVGLFIDFRVADVFNLAVGGGMVPLHVDVFMLLYWLGAIAALFLMLYFVRRRAFIGAPEFLGLVPVGSVSLLVWGGVLAVYYALFVVLPEMTMAREGFNYGPIGGGTFLYFVTAVTIAPLFEEALFRGFMFAGLARSRFRLAGAILITNTLWTAVHLRPGVEWFNEIYGLAVVFGAGLIFTLARLRTGSLAAPIILHGAWNATLLLGDAMVFSKL